MKKSFKRLAALLLVFSMLLPAAVCAASTYDVYVSISDVGGGAETSNTTVEGTLRYVSGNARMAEVLAQFVLAHYTDGVASTDLYAFDSPEMKNRVDAGLAIAASDGTNSKSDWAAFAAAYEFVCPYERSLHAKLSDYDTTVAQVGEGTHIVKHTNEAVGDRRYGVSYTASIVITERSSGGRTEPLKPTVNLSDVSGGRTDVSDKYAKSDDMVTLTAKPDAGMFVHHVDVRDEKGNRVPLLYDGAGVYRFKMPKGSVTVSVSYQKTATDPRTSGVSRLLKTEDHTAFLQGFAAGDFRPAASITRAQVAMIFYRLLRDQDVEPTKSFADVPEDYWAHDAIVALASLGILNGMTADRFAPDKQITRAQFCAVCARFGYELAELDSTVSFKDVPASHWAHKEIETAVAYGWINGYDDGSFRPDAWITRAQAAAIVNRMFARVADQIAVDQGEAKDYTDMDDSYWAWYDIQEASCGHNYENEAGFRHEFWKN